MKFKSGPTNERLSGIYLLLGGYLSYTVGDSFTKLLGAHYNTFELVAFFGLFSSMMVAIKALISRRYNFLKTGQPFLLGGRGVVIFLQSIACYYSFAHLPLVNVYSILFVSPIFITLLSFFLLREKVGWQIWLAVFGGFIGMLIMLHPGAAPISLALLAALVTPFTNTAAVILMRFGSRAGSNETVLFYSDFVTGCCAAMFAINDFVLPTASDIGLIVIMSFFITFASFLVIEGFRRTTTPVGAPFQYTELVWGAIFGWLIWGTLPDFWRFAGMAIVVASGLFTLWHEARLQQAAAKGKFPEPAA